MQRVMFKIAFEASEFEQIYRLDYETFVQEIPRYEASTPGRLVDRFDKENTYIICLRGKQLLGMVAVRGKRPFSLDERLGNCDVYLPPGRSACEIRLLAVGREHRKGPVFYGLLIRLAQYCKEQSYDIAVISGLVQQQKLYEHLGFVPFGRYVGTSDALFQPMYLTLEMFGEKAKSWRR